MGTVFVDNIKHQSAQGSGTITLGASGETVALASGATSGAGMGKVLQVVQMTFDTETTTTSSTFVDTGLTLSITPSSTTSKVLIMASFTGGNNTGAKSGTFTIDRDGTNLGNGSLGFSENIIAASGYHHNNVCLTFLDSPNTTSSTTFTIQMSARNGGTSYLNTNTTRGVLILQEISA